MTAPSARDRLLVDANIFIDANRKRAGWDDSLGVINLVEAGKTEGYVAALNPAFAYFDRRRQRLSERLSRDDGRCVLNAVQVCYHLAGDSIAEIDST